MERKSSQKLTLGVPNVLLEDSFCPFFLFPLYVGESLRNKFLWVNLSLCKQYPRTCPRRSLGTGQTLLRMCHWILLLWAAWSDRMSRFSVLWMPAVLQVQIHVTAKLIWQLDLLLKLSGYLSFLAINSCCSPCASSSDLLTIWWRDEAWKKE